MFSQQALSAALSAHYIIHWTVSTSQGFLCSISPPSSASSPSFCARTTCDDAKHVTDQQPHALQRFFLSPKQPSSHRPAIRSGLASLQVPASQALDGQVRPCLDVTLVPHLGHLAASNDKIRACGPVGNTSHRQACRFWTGWTRPAP